MDQVDTHVLRLHDAYHRASATMPAIRLNPFDHPVDFNDLWLPDLVSFFTYISEELSHLRTMVGAELDKEGLRVRRCRANPFRAPSPEPIRAIGRRL